MTELRPFNIKRVGHPERQHHSLRVDVSVVVSSQSVFLSTEKAEGSATRPTLDYDGIYGADTGPWMTAMFIETVYRELRKENSAQEPKAAHEGSGR